MKNIPLLASLALLSCACSSVRLGAPDRRAATDREMLRLAQAIDRFSQATGSAPQDAAQLSAYASPDLLTDEWGRPYRLEPFPGEPGAMRIISAGEDGGFGTADDVVFVHRRR